MKFKVIALAALMGISGMAAQANELPDGPHIVTSGTASVDAVPDIATLRLKLTHAKDAATAKKQADERVAQYISFLELNQIAKKISAQRTYAPSQIMIIRMVKVSLKATAL